MKKSLSESVSAWEQIWQKSALCRLKKAVCVSSDVKFAVSLNGFFAFSSLANRASSPPACRNRSSDARDSRNDSAASPLRTLWRWQFSRPASVRALDLCRWKSAALSNTVPLMASRQNRQSVTDSSTSRASSTDNRCDLRWSKNSASMRLQKMTRRTWAECLSCWVVGALGMCLRM